MYIGKIVGDKTFTEFKRVLYVYKSETIRTHKFDDRTQLDWLFPDYYSKTFGLSVRGFEFTFLNLSSSLKTFFEPSQNLINSKTGTEETTSVPTQATFFPEQKTIEKNIKKYNDISTKYFVNESYFLYNKSELIKETYITELKKRISIYGSKSYFDKKTEHEIFKIISPEKLLKFLVNKDTNKNSLSFQLTKINGELPVLKDKKVHNFSLTRIGRKRKLPMQDPTETIIIHVQQNFEIAGGLNPVKIEIEDDRVINTLKKHKNVIYKLTPLGILFPASIKHNTEQMYITCRELNNVKKTLINSKIYDLIGVIDLKKINNWSEIKGQSILDKCNT